MTTGTYAILGLGIAALTYLAIVTALACYAKKKGISKHI